MEQQTYCPQNEPVKKRGGKLTAVLAAVLVLLLIVVAVLLICRRKADNGPGPGAKVGDIVRFGTFEQDNSADAPEPIEWRILEIRDGKALVVSCRALDARAFCETDEDAGWANSSLRLWLNDGFYGSAFSDEEKSRIALTDVANPGTYAGYDDSGCWLVSNTAGKFRVIAAQADGQQNTEDRIFLLSVDEVAQYFVGETDARAFLSEYGVESFIRVGLEQARKIVGADEAAIRWDYEVETAKYGRGFCRWWLRSPGVIPGSAAGVDYDGSAGGSMAVTTEDGGVRPAMWIVLK